VATVNRKNKRCGVRILMFGNAADELRRGHGVTNYTSGIIMNSKFIKFFMMTI